VKQDVWENFSDRQLETMANSFACVTKGFIQILSQPHVLLWCQSILQGLLIGESATFALLIASDMTEPPKVVTLNVGGQVYTTTLYTITQYSDSKLAEIFNGESSVPKDPKGNYFIDRDGVLFKQVLNFLRTRKLVLPDDFKEFEQLEIEANFYKIKSLQEEVKKAKESHQSVDSGPEILRLFYSSGTKLVLAGGLGMLQQLVPNIRLLGGSIAKGPAYNFSTAKGVVEGGQATVPLKLEQLDAFLQHVVNEGFDVKMSDFFLDGNASQVWVFVRK